MPRAKSVDPTTERALNQGLGQRLQAVRLAQGRILTEVAACIGVSYQAYQKYEQGRSAVSYPRLVALAEALGVAPTALIDADALVDRQALVQDRRAQEASRTFAALAGRDQDLVLHILRDLSSRPS